MSTLLMSRHTLTATMFGLVVVFQVWAIVWTSSIWSMVAPLGVKKLDLTGLENTLCGCWVVICGRCGSFVGSACYLWVRG